MKSYFLTEKEGRRPLQKAMIQALLPTDSEAPKLQKKEEKKDAKKEEKKVSAHFPFRANPLGDATSVGIHPTILSLMPLRREEGMELQPPLNQYIWVEFLLSNLCFSYRIIL